MFLVLIANERKKTTILFGVYMSTQRNYSEFLIIIINEWNVSNLRNQYRKMEDRKKSGLHCSFRTQAQQ